MVWRPAPEMAATPAPRAERWLVSRWSANLAAPWPAHEPEEIAQAALWLPPPVNPPQMGSRVAASPAAYRPDTLVAQSSLVIRNPPVPRTVPSRRSVTEK